MVGIPGSSKGCTTCRRRKVRVSKFILSQASLTLLPRVDPLRKDSLSAISRSHSVPAAPIPEGRARGTPRFGDKEMPRRLLKRLPILVSSSSRVAPMPLTNRFYLSFGRGIFPLPKRTFLMAQIVTGFSKSSVPPAHQTQRLCSYRSRLCPSQGWLG